MTTESNESERRYCTGFNARLVKLPPKTLFHVSQAIEEQWKGFNSSVEYFLGGSNFVFAERNLSSIFIFKQRKLF